MKTTVKEYKMKFKIITLTFATLLMQQTYCMNWKNWAANFSNLLPKPSLKTAISIGISTATVTYGLKHIFAKLAQRGADCLTDIPKMCDIYENRWPMLDHKYVFANLEPYCTAIHDISSGAENFCNSLFYISSITTIGSLLYAIYKKNTLKKHSNSIPGTGPDQAMGRQ